MPEEEEGQGETIEEQSSTQGLVGEEQSSQQSNETSPVALDDPIGKSNESWEIVDDSRSLEHKRRV